MANSDETGRVLRAYAKAWLASDLEKVLAAAGTWNDNFGAAPADIVRVADGVVTDLKRG